MPLFIFVATTVLFDIGTFFRLDAVFHFSFQVASNFWWIVASFLRFGIVLGYPDLHNTTIKRSIYFSFFLKAPFDGIPTTATMTTTAVTTPMMTTATTATTTLATNRINNQPPSSFPLLFSPAIRRKAYQGMVTMARDSSSPFKS